MSVFRSIVFSAALSGLIVGAAVTAAQHLGTVPLIQLSETYEHQAAKAEVAKTDAAPHAHAGAKTAGEHQHQHQHDATAWEPKDGFERNAYTALANILTAVGFALLLGGLFVLVGRPVSAREGLFWGLAGFAVFTLAPGLGLPPELPGTPAAPIGERQAWWIATAAATAIGLALLVFRRAPWAAIAGLALIAAPHVIGAPRLGDAHSAVPEALSRQFVAVVTVTSLFFWALLGPLTAVLQRRFARYDEGAGLT